jgi:hyperosmotically inducible periplasmic protein
MRRTGVVMLLLALLPLTARADGRKPEDMVSDIRKELMGLPYYGVFDFLVFSSDGPTVTLGGYAYNGSLKTDAEREAKKVAGVENVVNNIEILPASINDDQIRWAAYRAIYRDAALSRYAPGGYHTAACGVSIGRSAALIRAGSPDRNRSAITRFTSSCRTAA